MPQMRSEKQLVISYELLKLLCWFVEHEQHAIKKLMLHALNNGLKHELAYADELQKDINMDHLQEYIIEFFTMLEMLMHETLHEHAIREDIQRTKIPAIHHIDITACDATSVALSVEKATSAAIKKTGENPKEVLCRELLKRWKPDKNHDVH